MLNYGPKVHVAGTPPMKKPANTSWRTIWIVKPLRMDAFKKAYRFVKYLEEERRSIRRGLPLSARSSAEQSTKLRILVSGVRISPGAF